MKKLLLIVLPILLIVVGAAMVLWVVFAPSMLHPKPKASTLTVAALKKCADKGKFYCYSDYFSAKVAATDPTSAFNDLRQIYGTNAYAKAQCHQLSHAIGHAALEKYKTLQAAYIHGDAYCWSGYYHGVTEKAIADMGAEKVKSEANTLCSQLAKAEPHSFYHFNCVHGLGHGFMVIANDDLFGALKTCDLLTDDWERTSCYGGSYMENVMIEAREGGKSAFLKPDQPMYPCTAVEHAYKEQCYLMQTSYALTQRAQDFGAVFELCRTLPDQEFVTTCYQSLGRDASGHTSSDVAGTVANCHPAPNDEALQGCMVGAVKDFISFYHSDTQAKDLCKAFGGATTANCLREAADYYKSF